MDLFRRLAHRASTAVAALLLAGSLTCLTSACRVICAAEAGESAPATAAADLPPCHRGAAEAPAPAGGCDAGSPCCARWLDDHAALRLADPASLRTLLPGDAGPGGPALLVATLGLGMDPAGRDPAASLLPDETVPPSAPSGAPRIPRAPPAA